MLQIKIEQTNRIEKETGLTCLDDCIATLANYYQCHYEMMYADGFEVLSGSGEYYFASSYHIRLVNGPRNLTDYHGMTLQKKDFFTKRKMKREIQNEIKEGFIYLCGRKSRFAKIYGKRIDMAYLERELERELGNSVVLLSDDKKIILYTEPEQSRRVLEYVQSKTGIYAGVLEYKDICNLPRNEYGKIRYH